MGDSRVKVGVRYCGGCNPHYSRSGMVKRVTGKHEDWDVEIAQEGVKYDLLIVPCGCTGACAAYKHYDYDKAVRVWQDIEDITDAVEWYL